MSSTFQAVEQWKFYGSVTRIPPFPDEVMVWTPIVVERISFFWYEHYIYYSLNTIRADPAFSTSGKPDSKTRHVHAWRNLGDVLTHFIALGHTFVTKASRIFWKVYTFLCRAFDAEMTSFFQLFRSERKEGFRNDFKCSARLVCAKNETG